MLLGGHGEVEQAGEPLGGGVHAGGVHIAPVVPNPRWSTIRASTASTTTVRTSGAPRTAYPVRAGYLWSSRASIAETA